MVNKNYLRKYNEEEDGEADDAAGTAATDTWSFDGYTVEFNDKTGLTPVTGTVKQKTT
jgi:hypothetical protein